MIQWCCWAQQCQLQPTRKQGLLSLLSVLFFTKTNLWLNALFLDLKFWLHPGKLSQPNSASISTGEPESTVLNVSCSQCGGAWSTMEMGFADRPFVFQAATLLLVAFHRHRPLSIKCQYGINVAIDNDDYLNARSKFWIRSLQLFARDKVRLHLMTITWRLDRSIAAIGQYQHQASVLFSMENVIFWLILAALFQTYGLFGVLLLAEIMRWCTKVTNIRYG